MEQRMAPGYRPSKTQQLATLEFADKVTGELWRFFRTRSQKDEQDATSRQLYTYMLEIHEWLAEQTSAMLEDDVSKSSLDTVLKNLEKLCKVSHLLHPAKAWNKSGSSHDNVPPSGLRLPVQQPGGQFRIA